jgi:hypothetical protein
LLMPRLGQAVEPAHAGPVQPWWREADPARRSGRIAHAPAPG